MVFGLHLDSRAGLDAHPPGIDGPGAKLDSKLREKSLLPPVGTGRRDSQEGRSGTARLRHFTSILKTNSYYAYY